ncbi:CRTAC1 family protein [Aquimarina sp. 2201CG5-10]|uniref:CRTAC1 family protein n=1 Tax=Aquimarina callyspongiae TaxID=3098150 RepID=UPI002AB5B231|nr:CRTAC1 family protein [Aquimarina sp. 2201CG5-10]MDY8135296.1 CRTAC1 family protein [Aquimarina sp. 2201CG5-10]
MRYRFQNTYISFFACISVLFVSYAQEDSSFLEIIQKIQELEKNKDPKCYATANRLEDFMYGTPLEENARNFKIEIQKELILYLKKQGSLEAKANNDKVIKAKYLLPVINSLSSFGKNRTGSFLYKFDNKFIEILKKDFDQYSSISYVYRSLLSVEQDALFFPTNDLLSFDKESIPLVNDYVNLVTLVTLKIADNIARNKNLQYITKELIKDSWILVLQQSKKNKKPISIAYLKPNNTIKITNSNHDVIKAVIKQKIASYQKYNQVNASVFLRNVQVYFARQKWPIDSVGSTTLKNYYLESLIQFTNALWKQSESYAIKKNHLLIRVDDVQSALYNFLPSYTNAFEDVTFFPNNQKEKITLESYDLDSFRDSGFHWNLLKYSLADLDKQPLKSLDPNAAELMVEGIAQMGVLALRLAGIYSQENQKKVLDTQDITQGFKQIQSLIDSYNSFAPDTKKTNINSSTSHSEKTYGFEEVNNKTNLHFEHKSADWLNRLIRSYTTSYKEQKIKLAIPPAFGGSGIACEDINGDGLIDVLLLGGFGNKLFLNSEKGNYFKDVTDISNINNWNNQLNSFGEPRQPIIADFNNDGTQDIFITYVNDRHKLYKNIDGTHFEDVSQSANLGGENAVAGPATALDYDNDGLLDIFIGYFGNYIEGTLPILSRDNQNGMPNKLFRNLGNFVFEEIPFTQNTTANSGWTQAIGHTDINQDGLQDIIVGNDFGVNKYYLNSNTGLFKEVSKQLGTDKPSYSMNVGITDLNRDLYPDFYISNIVVMQKDEKYVNPNQDTQMKFDPQKMANIRTIEANDLFLSSVKNNSLNNYNLSTNVGRGYSATGWSWDADFFDYDNDGDEDLYCLNGMNDFSVYSAENPFYFEREERSKTVTYAESNREKNVFFVNDGGELINKASELGVDINSNARSAAYFDYDNDGDLDIIVNNYHDSANMLENKNSNTNNWIKIKLIGDPKVKINRDAIGSSMVLNSKNHKNIWREIHSTTGYLSVHPKVQHFGLGKDTSVNVEIRWSNGERYDIKNLKANISYEISYPNQIRIIQ